ncbi:MAG: 50S ribosomal protein L29 [Candidatus Buchananbacteria bacterium]
MKVKELREKSPTELRKEIAEEQVKLRELKFKIASKQLKNVREIRVVRLGIAKRLTILKEKESKQ